MSRRITIPADHIALVLSSQLSDEVFNYVQARRRALGQKMHRIQQLAIKDGDSTLQKNIYSEPYHEAKVERSVLNDFLLALVDAREA